MSDGTTGTEVTQALDAALAAYQRHFGRLRTIEKLDHMAASRREAQRLMQDAEARSGTPTRRAAE